VHGFFKGGKFFGVYDFFGFVDACVSGSESSHVLFKAVFYVSGAACVVGSVFALQHIDVVGH